MTSIFRGRVQESALILGTALLAACAAVEAPSADQGNGSGGALWQGTGAATGSGGALGTGGAIATGGAVATGGAIATGGSVATGGAVATGGSIATGGTVSTGGSTATGGGSSACTTADGTGTFTRNIEDGRLESTGVSGYGFAYISPSQGGVAIDCGALGAAATGICASGTVPAEAAYSAVGGIAVNVNQAGGDGTSAAAYPKTVTSLTVSYQNKTTGTLRVQATTATGEFCKTLSNGATSATLTPADFNSKCWDGSGSTWNGTGLTSIQLIVPSNNLVTTPMNACLNGVTLTP